MSSSTNRSLENRNGTRSLALGLLASASGAWLAIAISPNNGTESSLQPAFAVVRLLVGACAFVGLLTFSLAILSVVLARRSATGSARRRASDAIARALPKPVRRWRNVAVGVAVGALVSSGSVRAGATARDTMPGRERPVATAVEIDSLDAATTRPAGDPASGQQWPSRAQLQAEPSSENRKSGDAIETGGIPNSVQADSTDVSRVSTTAAGSPTTDPTTIIRPTATAKPTATTKPTATSKATTTIAGTTARTTGATAPEATSTTAEPVVQREESSRLAASQGNPVMSKSGAESEARYTVVAGDSFWSIAENTMLAIDRDATEQRVAQYWKHLVASNPEIANPDMLLPGTSITIPPPQR